MPPETESSMPSKFYRGFELVDLNDPAIPTTTIMSTIANPPHVPNNSFATGQAPPTSIDGLTPGHFGVLASFTSCFPNFYSLFSPISFQRNGQLTSRQTQQDANENYEIALECIEVNFNKDYIGGGNQSSVFKGKWNGGYIALKKLNRASEVDIQKLAELKHPNVVKTIGICSKDIYPCIVMEYCDKGSLFDLLSKEHVGKHKFLRWSKEIASGMQYLHNEWKIIHRDLKSPNVLVDGKDTLRICDFGSLYSYSDKTHMQSVAMSCCGTSQWMAPELLRNEPCNEKIDVWSFGVIMWELLIQLIPYKNISSMAIMFGVGNGNLRLHLPRTLPDTCKLLLKVCFANRPRNRYSFGSILNHLTNLEVEIASINEEGWRMRKEVWQREVNDEAEKLRQNSLNGNNAQELNQEQLDELVTKRMNELRHAEELRQMYLVKMDRVDDMLRKLMGFQEQTKREHTATKSRPNGSEIKSVKVKKSTVTSMRGKKTTTDVYPRAGQRAVLTMEVDDNSEDLHNNNAESDESLYETDAEEAERRVNRSDPNMCQTSENLLPNIPNTLSPPMQERLVDGGTIVSTPKRRISQTSLLSSSDDEQFVAVPRSRHSYGATSHQNSFEECCNSKFSSRATSARSSMNFAQRQLAVDARANRNSISHLPPYENSDDTQFVCPCCNYDFRSYSFVRNSSPRTSGISADSGVASTMHDREMSALSLASTSDFYRNQQIRWSDGRIRHHAGQSSRTPHRPNRRQTGFTRNSPARRVTSANNSKRHRPNFNSTGCLETAVANVSISNQIPCSSNASNSQPKLSNSQQEDEDEEMPQNEMESGLFMNAIQEMESSSSTKRSLIMEQSSSTSASALERSLEHDIANGDLTDKESKLKLCAAKTKFRTHRRCASNPTNIIDKGIGRIVESTTESDNDPVYC